MLERFRKFRVSLAAVLALSSYMVDVAQPVLAATLHLMPAGCRCSTGGTGGSCQCSGGCCSAKDSEKQTSRAAKSCCSAKPLTDASCCAVSADGTVESELPPCCRKKVAATKKKDPVTPSFRGHCRCGDRPDTATGDAPPRVVPDLGPESLIDGATSPLWLCGVIYASVDERPATPPPDVA